jgi:hypothetical protein
MTTTAIHPSTGETLTYTGTREVRWATFARGARNFELIRGRKVWTVTDSGEGSEWLWIGWSSAPTRDKAINAAKGTTAGYRAQYHAVPVQ